MASISPSTPLRRRLNSTDSESNAPTGNRSRLSSAEIPRTYSGLYGAGDGAPDNYGENQDGASAGCNDSTHISSPPRVHSSLSQESSSNNFPRHHYQKGSNLLPFELSRNRNTDWIAAGGPPLLLTYLSFILIFLLTFLAFVTEPKVAWTLTNVVHGMFSMVYLHWVKGNPADYMDGTQGEMNAMTLWEQIVSKPTTHLHATNSNDPNTASTNNNSNTKLESSAAPRVRGSGRDVLIVIPTLLAHASCCVAKYQFQFAAVNVGVWAVVMLPKMPFMNGVRILGINRTAGIDDGDYGADEEEEEDCVDANEENLNYSNNDVGMEFSPTGDDNKENDIGMECKVDEPKKNR